MSPTAGTGVSGLDGGIPATGPRALTRKHEGLRKSPMSLPRT
jgi:hypothetical protein